MGNVVHIDQKQPPRVELTSKQLELMRRTVASDCNNEEFDLFIEAAKRIGLDPFRKQIYAVVYSKNDKDKRKMSIITGIDGYRSVAARNRDYRPDSDPPQIVYDEDLKGSDNPLGILKAVVRCWKLGPDNQWYAIAGEAYWSEYAVIKEKGEDDDYEWVKTGETYPEGHKKAGQPKYRRKLKDGASSELQPDGKWKSMPHVMIAKCAEAQALRKGWPEDLSGVYVAEEMDRANIIDVTASEMAEQAAVDRRLELIAGKDTLIVLWQPGAPLESVPFGQFADKAIAWLHDAKSAADIEAWRDTNRAPLQEFWARSKSDALSVKAFMEKRIAQLKTPALPNG